jgi:translation initiation factor eIF-2B subunit delta
MADPIEQAPVAQTSALTSQEPQPTETPQTLPIRDSKPAKPTEKDAPASADGATGKPLTPAELKKMAKAEKAARRAREKVDREGGAPGGAAPGPGAGQARPPTTPKKDTAAGAAQKGQKMPTARRGSVALAQSGSALVEQKKKRDDKKVAVFGHLYGQQRRTTIAGGGKEVHPAVLALGLQLRDYVVCGSSARCVSTMIAFKRVCLFFHRTIVLYTNSSRSLKLTQPLWAHHLPAT